MEEWKQIKTYGYEASTDGRIRNIKTGRILKQRMSSDGYFIVDIQIEKKNRTFKTHRLIADTFLEKDLVRVEVDHINRNKTDNKVTNLRWVTRIENMQNVDWENVIRKRISIDKIKEIIYFFEKGKTFDEIHELINLVVTK